MTTAHPLAEVVPRAFPWPTGPFPKGSVFCPQRFAPEAGQDLDVCLPKKLPEDAFGFLDPPPAPQLARTTHFQFCLEWALQLQLKHAVLMQRENLQPQVKPPSPARKGLLFLFAVSPTKPFFNRVPDTFSSSWLQKKSLQSSQFQLFSSAFSELLKAVFLGQFGDSPAFIVLCCLCGLVVFIGATPGFEIGRVGFWGKRAPP